ncbi:GH25 family lysozyme [Stackebrandtia soli]|uniref:GH25 family lysozyme n=1 Tax=Stackebrandtia soli TaxID=1892856 RepID=UPI0039ED4C02
MNYRSALTALGATTLLAAAVLSAPAHAASIDATTVPGIDAATTQASLDFGQAAAEGHQFAIVKAGGSQLSDGPYVSPHYTRQVDEARAAGMTVGHYWLVGDFQSPVAAADYFVDHLHDYREGDVIALDNEALDDSVNLWNDAQVATWFQRVQSRLGDLVPWVYMSSSVVRSMDWDATVATGVKLWVAMWGANDGSYPGEPDLGGKFPGWAAHQYTSVGTAGGTHPVDLNVAKPDAFEIVPGDGGPPPGEDPLPKTSTETDGIPGVIFWQRAQNWLSMEAGYTGPIDGVPGVNTYAALQRELRDHYGYTGPIDGVPGPNTYAALQRLAAEHGYTGPIDGVPGPNTWRGVARFLNQDRWD